MNTKRLRLMIGWLGILLPWVLIAILGYFPSSVSATYYTNGAAVFLVTLGSASFLLMSYMGYEPIDDLTMTFTGICGLGICLFPAYNKELERVGTFLLRSETSGRIHNIYAVAFFLLLSYNSMFLFTKSRGAMTENKRKRNIIYRICGVGIVLSSLIVFVPDFPNKIWLAEAMALLFFGISFLTKADRYKWLFCDREKILFKVNNSALFDDNHYEVKTKERTI